MNRDYVRRYPGLDLMSAIRARAVEALRLDFTLMFLLLGISAYGLLVLYSAVDQDTGPVIAQGIRILVGFTSMILIAQVSPMFLCRFAPWAFVLGLVLLVLVLLFGLEINGSVRWLGIPGLFSFQPSEFMKLLLPLTLAWYFHDRQLSPKLHHLGWSLVIIMIPVLLVAVQPDLGTALIIGASGIFVLLLTGISWRLVSCAFGVGLLATPVLWWLMRDYQRQRILTLLDPERDPLGAGWNIIQSKTAVGSGGVFGKGLLEGTQSHLDFLPESRTDFIIAVLGEELGLMGVILLLALYMLLIQRGVRLSAQVKDTFGRLSSGSITLTFFVYVFVNMGMVSGVLPVVGVPLPLVSYGGTSILTLFAGFGILMSVHRSRRIVS